MYWWFVFWSVKVDNIVGGINGCIGKVDYWYYFGYCCGVVIGGDLDFGIIFYWVVFGSGGFVGCCYFWGFICCIDYYFGSRCVVDGKM